MSDADPAGHESVPSDVIDHTIPVGVPRKRKRFEDHDEEGRYIRNVEVAAQLKADVAAMTIALKHLGAKAGYGEHDILSIVGEAMTRAEVYAEELVVRMAG